MKDRFATWWRRKSPGTRILLGVIPILAAVIIISNIAFYAISTSPRACTVCHFMKPYYEQWKSSTHNGMSCLKCHPFSSITNTMNTLKYLTNTYRPVPIAEVKDSSCLQTGCHSERLLPGKIPFKGTISFDHSDHYGKSKRGEKLRCASCHSQIVQGKHIAVTEKVCFLCHFKGAARGTSVTGCPSCHGTPTKIVEHEGFSFSHESYLKAGVACNQCHLDIVKGDGAVPEGKCRTCHVERLEKYKDKIFIHNVHVTGKGIYCFNCHEEIEHGEIRMIQALEVKCETCHKKTHSPQKEMYMGTSGRGVKDVPSRMFAAQVTCDGCHTHGTPKTGEERTLEAERNSCVTCHGKGYDLMLDDWRREISRAASMVAPVIAGAKKAASGTGKRGQEAAALLDDASYNLALVKDGKGAHNPEYAVRLLSSAWDQADVAMKAVQPGFAAKKRPPLLGSADGYCAALCHGRTGLRDTLTFKDMALEFPHRFHNAMLGIECTTCHSPDKHKQRIISKDGCMACHHKGDAAQKCQTCHGSQESLYLGRVKFPGVQASKDVMAKGGVGCDGCHDLKEKDHSVAALKSRCVQCHDKGFDDMLITWEQDLLKAQAALTAKIAEVEDRVAAAKNSPSGTTALSRAQSAVNDAKRIRDLVERGRGIHNYQLASDLLTSALNSLLSLQKEMEKKAP